MRVARRLLVTVFFIAGCSSSPIAGWGVSPFAGWDSYSFAGKPTLALRGDLEDLVISPSGKSIAFNGFQQWRKVPGIFVGAIDGALRYVAARENTGELMEMAWSQDEASLTYSIVGSDIASNGMVIKRTNVADGHTTVLARTEGWVGLAVSPVIDRVVWFGGNHDETIPFTMLNTATGDQRTILKEAQPERAVWSSDGAMLGLVYGEKRKGPLTLALLADGSDTPVPLETLGKDDRLESVYWTADGVFTALVVPRSTSTLTLRRYVSGGGPVDTKLDFVSEAIGATYFVPSPAGSRLHTNYDFKRQDMFIPEDPVQESHPEPTVQNALVDLQARTVKKFPPRVVPHGWLDEDRVLISTGVGNYKEYSILDVRRLQ